MDNFNKLLSWLKTLPIWLRSIVLLALSAIVLIASMSLYACGPVVKVSVRGTKDGVTINTTQSASDSSSLNIQVNPNINFNPIK